MSSRLRIVVGGLAGLNPVGGMAFHYLQYVIGLSRLGHDVYYHEDTWSWPYHPLERTQTAEGGYSASFLDGFFARYAPELRDRWHYLHLHEQTFGMSRRRFDEVARSADLFLNVSGSCMLPDGLSSRCVKVFVDTDPGYNQIMLAERLEWSEYVDRWCDLVATHDRHLTFAENIHGPDCRVPTLEFDWRTTRMPVVLDLWEPVRRAPAARGLPWTTVMTWNPFKGPLVHRGVEYRGKDAQFERLMDLPRSTAVPLTVAVGGIGAPMQRLADHGWEVVDGPSATLSGESYQRFLGGSRGEVSVAKQVYVALRTGWFSERSASYLAGARPVVVEDTGFGASLPVGEGLLTFTTPEEALTCVEAVESDYERHAARALDIAGECFDSTKVLGRLLDDAFREARPRATRAAEV